MRVRITPSSVTGVVSAPPSKSYTHRAVILASLAAGETRIENPLASDDTLYTVDACCSLGTDIKLDGNILRVIGTGGQIKVAPGKERIFVGNSGSTIRMVAPLAALSQTKVAFDGDARLRQRPVGDLLSALESLGVRARSLGNNGHPPIEIQGGRLTSGEVIIPGLASSQYITSLLMIAPYVEGEMRIKVVGGLHSKPYIDITLDVMRAFGVDVTNHDYKEFLVKGSQKYRGRHYSIEGDYSSAAYFLAAGAIGRRPVSVTNLKADSVQGDRYLLSILSEMGCRIDYQEEQVSVCRDKELEGVTIDMGDYPDIVQTMAVVAAYARGKTEITNIGHLKFKETDRLSNTAVELGKIGIRVDVTGNTMVVYGGKPKGAEIDAYSDHRMAMSFAIAALFGDGDSIINGAEAVTKSYPQFFTELAKLGAKIEELS